VPVLGLSVALGAAAFLVVPMLARPVFPLFGYLVAGWGAAALMLGGAAVSVALAWSTFHLRMSGWWGSMVALVLLGVSTWVTFLRVDPAEFYRAMGYPEEHVRMLAGMLDGPTTAWSSLVITVLTIAYMLSIRKHFLSGPGPSA
jgi:hypothetical protein